MKKLRFLWTSNEINSIFLDKCVLVWRWFNHWQVIIVHRIHTVHFWWDWQAVHLCILLFHPIVAKCLSVYWRVWQIIWAKVRKAPILFKNNTCKLVFSLRYRLSINSILLEILMNPWQVISILRVCWILGWKDLHKSMLRTDYRRYFHPSDETKGFRGIFSWNQRKNVAVSNDIQ